MGEDKGHYVRTYGLGPSVKDLWGSKDTRLALRQMASAAQKASEESIEQLNARIDAVNVRVDTVDFKIDKLIGVLVSKCPEVNFEELLKSPSQVTTDISLLTSIP